MKATSEVTSRASNVKPGIPLPGTPLVITLAIASSESGALNRPSFKSTAGTPSPVLPWQARHCWPYSRLPASTTAASYWPWS